MPSFRVTYRVVVQAESSDEAIAEAAKAAESGGLSEPGVRADVAVGRDPSEAPPASSRKVSGGSTGRPRADGRIARRQTLTTRATERRILDGEARFPSPGLSAHA